MLKKPLLSRYAASPFFAAFLWSCVAWGSTAFAAPTIQSVSLRGLQAGAETRLVITGAELAPDPILLFQAPNSEAQVLPGSAANRMEAIIRVPPDVPAGVYYLRVATKQGVSNPVSLSVDSLPQSGFTEIIDSLPIALTGTVSGSQILKATFQGSKDQVVSMEVESRRLGSALRPVVRLLDARGGQLAFSASHSSLQGDAWCYAKLPADGQYVVVLHDVLYRGANPGHFRLKIGDFRFAPHALPLAVKSGTRAELHLVGGSAGKVTLDASSYITGERQPIRAAANAKLASAQQIMITDSAEVLEQSDSGGVTQLPAAPVGASGRISAQGEEDRFMLPVQPGSKIRVDLFAERIGSPLDGVVVLRGEAGNELARNDDQPDTTDPRIDYTVPNGVTKLMIAVQDLRRQGGEDYVYRVGVRDLSRPDFSLVADQERIQLPEGGSKLLRVTATRNTYNGPIELMLPDLPEHIQLTGNRIEAGATLALLALTSTKPERFASVVRIVGRTEGDSALTRVASVQSAGSDAKLQSWLATELAVGSAPAEALRVAWANDDGPLTTHLGGLKPVEVKIDRSAGTAGDVRLKLLATQQIPKKKIKQNNKEVQIDDLDRALRLQTDVTVAADASSAKVNIFTPADLPDRTWSVVMAAELISPKTKKPVMTVYSSARLLRRVVPFKITRTSDAAIQARAGEGETGSFQGKIERFDGFQQPVTISLEGLPAGYAAPSVTAPGDAVAFELPIRFAAESKPAELKNVRLVATYAPNAENKNLVVRSDAGVVSIQVVKQ